MFVRVRVSTVFHYHMLHGDGDGDRKWQLAKIWREIWRLRHPQVPRRGCFGDGKRHLLEVSVQRSHYLSCLKKVQLLGFSNLELLYLTLISHSYSLLMRFKKTLWSYQFCRSKCVLWFRIEKLTRLEWSERRPETSRPEPIRPESVVRLPDSHPTKKWP